MLATHNCVMLIYVLGMGRSVPQGAVTTINCAVNPALNSQQAIYYSEGTPKRPSVIARLLLCFCVCAHACACVHAYVCMCACAYVTVYMNV